MAKGSGGLVLGLAAVGVLAAVALSSSPAKAAPAPPKPNPLPPGPTPMPSPSPAPAPVPAPKAIYVAGCRVDNNFPAQYQADMQAMLASTPLPTNDELETVAQLYQLGGFPLAAACLRARKS